MLEQHNEVVILVKQAHLGIPQTSPTVVTKMKPAQLFVLEQGLVQSIGATLMDGSIPVFQDLLFWGHQFYLVQQTGFGLLLSNRLDRK